MADIDKGLYARALQRFREEFIPIYKGKRFSSDDVYRFFQLDKRPNAVDAKRAMGQVLYNLSRVNKEPELEQTGKVYRIIDRTLNVIEWWKAAKGDIFKLNWMYGVEDNSSFGFEDSIVLYHGDLIVIAGEGNSAKTTICLNLLVQNCNTYPCYYFTKEFNDAKFIDRMGHFDWVNLYKEDGTPKFTVIKQTENWQDVIQPDAINIIDWIYLEDEMWKMRGIMDNIIKKLNRGIAVIAIQKRSYKQVGEGGEATKDLSSVYFTVRNDKDLNRVVLKVEKVKIFEGQNPNFREYDFDVVGHGAKIHNIIELETGKKKQKAKPESDPSLF